MCQLTFYRVGFSPAVCRNQQSAPLVKDLEKAPFGCITMGIAYKTAPRPGKRDLWRGVNRRATPKKSSNALVLPEGV
jgi:hypothetical protein